MRRVLQRVVFVVMAVAAFAAMGSADAAFEVSLPDVGSEIQFDFSPPVNVFSIAADVPSGAAFEGEATFSGGKALRKVYDAAYAPTDGLYLTIILRGDGLTLDLEEELRAFDEEATLLRPDGSVIETATNSNYGHFDMSDDTLAFGWDYHSLGTLDIGGFSWCITPDVLPGRPLPETLSVDFYMWGSRLVVVPEPATATAMTSALVAAGLMLHGRPRKV